MATKKQSPKAKPSITEQIRRELLKMDPHFYPVVKAYIKALKQIRREEARAA